MLKQFAKISFRNILYAPRKSLLAILAVSACYFSLNIFQGYIAGSEIIFLDSYSQRSMLGDLVIRKSGIRHMLSMDPDDLVSEEEQAKIDAILQKIGGVDIKVRFLRVIGTLTNGSAQMIFTGSGVDVDQGIKMRQPHWGWNTLAGKPLEDNEAPKILVGQTLGNLLHCSPATKENFITGLGGYSAKERPMDCPNPKIQLQTATLNGQANAVEVEIIGLVDSMFRELDQRFIYIPLPVAQRLLDTKRISFYAIRLLPGTHEDEFLQQFREEAKVQGLNLTAHSWKQDEIGDFYHRTMDFLHVFRNFMVIVILSVALLSIFNTFYRSVQERIREIGVLRTLGFQLSHVRSLFLVETFFLSLFGIGIGAALSISVAFLFQRITLLYKIGLLTQPVPFLISMHPLTMLWTALTVIFVAQLAALIPLLIMGRKQITEALTST